MAKVKHAVVVRLKPETPEEATRAILQALDDLRHTIPGLLDFSGGSYSSPEGLNQGFTHGFIMTFADAASRDVYLPHPAHEAVKGQIVPHVDSILAFDFEV